MPKTAGAVMRKRKPPAEENVRISDIIPVCLSGRRGFFIPELRGSASRTILLKLLENQKKEENKA